MPLRVDLLFVMHELALQIDKDLIALIFLDGVVGPDCIHQRLPLHLVNKHRERNLLFAGFTLC